MPTLHGKNVALRFEDQAKYAPLLALLPKSKLLPDPRDGYPTLIVNHGLEEHLVFRNLGITSVPNPLRNPAVYSWPGTFTPMPHQIDTAEFLTLHRKCFVFNQQRTGKTMSALWAADYLMQQGVIKKALIVTTISTMRDVWEEAVFNHLSYRNSAVLHGSRARRLKLLDPSTTPNIDFYIINHDGIEVIFDELQARTDIDLVIVDEASYLRSAGTGRYKLMEKLIATSIPVHPRRLWLMTGTPVPNAPTDAWGLTKLVSPDRIPKYFGRFKDMTMSQITPYKWVPKHDAFTIAFDAMQPAIRIKKADVIKNLPPLTWQYREVELTNEQLKAYRQMHAAFVMQDRDGSSVSAVNAADKVNKLRQISTGCYKAPDGEYHELDYSNRYKVLKGCIAEAGEAAKIIIFVPFKGILRSLTERLRGDGFTCEFVNGDVSATARSRIFNAFKTEVNPQILLAHPRVASHGLELAVSSDIIWYAPYFSFEEFDQANARIASGMQKNAMTIVMLHATKLERDIYTVLKSKERGQNAILDLYKRELNDE